MQALPTEARFEIATGSPSRVGNRLAWAVGPLRSTGSAPFTVKVTADCSEPADSSAAVMTTTCDLDSCNDRTIVGSNVN